MAKENEGGQTSSDLDRSRATSAKAAKMLEYLIGPTLDPPHRVLSLMVDELDDPPVALHGNGLSSATLEINAQN